MTPYAELRSNQSETRNASRPEPVKDHRFGAGSVFDLHIHCGQRDKMAVAVLPDTNSIPALTGQAMQSYTVTD